MASRLQLQRKLEDLYPEFKDEIYFQPGKNVRMGVPAIVYSKSAPDVKRADGKRYIVTNKYTLTYIHLSPDDPIADDLPNQFDHCAWSDRFVSDNTYHDVYTLYY